MMNLYVDLLVCIVCRSSLIMNGESLVCTNSGCRKEFGIINGIPKMISPQLEKDLQLSQEKWETFYHEKSSHKQDEHEQRYIRDHYASIVTQLDRAMPIQDIVFLEIGCGTMLLGKAIANRCKLVIGVDISLSALLGAKKMLDENGIRNYLLLLADVNNIPLKNNTVDLLYGGGVIEHFQNTEAAVRELYRVLHSNGIAFNTVPLLNIGSLTYRQVWGNIPNFPVLKQIAEFIHIKLLRAKHMRFGYELSFTAHTLKSIHRKVGFRDVRVEQWETELMFDFIPFRFLKKMCTYVAERSRLFWPMVKVIARK